MQPVSWEHPEVAGCLESKINPVPPPAFLLNQPKSLNGVSIFVHLGFKLKRGWS